VLVQQIKEETTATSTHACGDQAADSAVAVAGVLEGRQRGLTVHHERLAGPNDHLTCARGGGSGLGLG